jgi:hypothetical protein
MILCIVIVVCVVVVMKEKFWRSVRSSALMIDCLPRSKRGEGDFVDCCEHGKFQISNTPGITTLKF